MYVLSATKKSRKARIPVGQYSSVVTAIEYDENYADQEALKVYYKLTTDDGASFDYTEVFYNDVANQRTSQFFDYLSTAGIQEREDGLPELVGFAETLTLKRKVGYFIPIIIEREPA